MDLKTEPEKTSAQTFSEIYYGAHDGLTLYARDYPAIGNTDAPVIMCWHGLTRNSRDFDAIAQRLQKHYRVICPDQRGRGRSEYDSDSANYALPIYCRDMLTLTQHLGLSQIIVIGTSMGGLMAMGMMALSPHLIKAAVLNDIGPDIEARGLERIKDYVGTPVVYETWEAAAQGVRAVNACAFPDYTQSDWNAFARRTCMQTGEGIVPAYDLAIAEPILAQDGAAAPPDLWPLYTALAQNPVLVVRGGLSDLLSAITFNKMIEQGAQGVQEDQGVKGVIVPNVGHAPMLNEAEALAAIDGFLQSL